jgi:CRISPR-associated exonuclease Cas4
LPPLLILAVVLLVLAGGLWLLAQRTRRAAGLPAGRVVYTDTRGGVRPPKPLFSEALKLTGKPDYLVRHRGRYVPVEVKSGRAPAGGPHAGHVYQLAAYCALVSETYGRRPAYGLIRYSDQTLAVDYTPALEAELRSLLAAMQADDGAADVARSHESPARCRSCGFREVCEAALI